MIPHPALPWPCPLQSHIPHLTSHIPHLTSHIPHLTSHIPHLTPHIPHLTPHISHPTSHIPHPTSHTPYPFTPPAPHASSARTINAEYHRTRGGCRVPTGNWAGCVVLAAVVVLWGGKGAQSFLRSGGMGLWSGIFIFIWIGRVGIVVVTWGRVGDRGGG